MGLCRVPLRTRFRSKMARENEARKSGGPRGKGSLMLQVFSEGLNIMTPIQASTSEKRVVFLWSLFGVTVVCRVTQEFCVDGVSKFSQKGNCFNDFLTMTLKPEALTVRNGTG